jgi:hypothetical protein
MRRSVTADSGCPSIFLWLRRQRLFVRHARQTSRRLQREATLARMQHEQECCTRALQAKEQHRQAAAARARAITNEANERHQQAEVAIGEQRQQAATACVKTLADATAEHRCHEAAAASAELHLAKVQRFEDALAKETRRQAALAEAKRQEDALAAEECQWAALNTAIERIRTEFALCAAPLDAILAEKACEATAFESAPSPHRPTSYVDAVLFTMGGGHTTVFAPYSLALCSGACGSTIARPQRPTPASTPTCQTSSLHWSMQLPLCAQSSR